MTDKAVLEDLYFVSEGTVAQGSGESSATV